MTTEQILMLKMDVPGNKEKLQKALRKIKKFEKYDINTDIPLEKLEHFLWYVCTNYCVVTQWMHASFYGDRLRYTWGAKRSDTHEWIEDVYGISIYEVVAKLVIMLYSRIKKGEIPKKEIV